MLLAIIRKQLNIEKSLYEIFQILSVSVFEKEPLKQILTKTKISTDLTEIDAQLHFGF